MVVLVSTSVATHQFVKMLTSYVHFALSSILPLIGWEEHADQVILVVRNIRHTIDEYHDILADIGKFRWNKTVYIYYQYHLKPN